MDRHAIRACMACALMISTLPVWSAVGRTPGSFSVSPTGTAQYVIPLWSPPGTHGLNPALALAYHHTAGNGPLGMGWSISGLSLVTRCDSTWAQDGAPRDVRNDSSDTFCLDGNKLRLTAGTYGAPGATYQTEIETFSRITSFGIAGNGPQSFSVERKDGLIYEYGNTADSRIESVGQGSARAWALNQIRDRSGNAILFNYEEDTVNGAFRLATLDYTRNAAQGLSAAYRVQFVYESKLSSEIDSQYVAGSVIKEIKRLDRIDIQYNTATVRTYEMTYESALSSTGKSRLSSVQECVGSDCFAATTFTYQNGTAGLNAEVATSASIPTGVIPIALDVNNDGRSDLAYSSSATSGSGVWMVMMAHPSGGFNTPINTGVANTQYSGAIYIDYNADGYEDLLVPYSGGTWWVMLGGSSGLGAPSNTGAPVTATGSGDNARAIDINGDGLDDLVWADLVGYAGGDAIRYRLREWGGAFSSTVYTLEGPAPADTLIVNPVFTPGQNFLVRAPDFNGDGRVDLAFRKTRREFDQERGIWLYNYSVNVMCQGGWNFAVGGTTARSAPLFGDLNGDGKTDILYYTNGGSFEYRLSRGTAFGPALAGPTVAPYGRFALLDWDGDGNDDLLARVTATGAWHVYRSTGESFLATPATPGLAFDAASIAIADINGDGMADFGYNAGGLWRYRTRTGSYPDLLQNATDGFGNAVLFNYTPLTQGTYTKSSGATFPEQDYQGPLYTVSSYAASNGIGGTYTETFSYAGARIHRQGRGFEGFYQRISQDSRNALYHYEYFNREFPRTGTIFQEDIIQPNNVTVISRTVHSWASHSYGSGSNARSLPYISASTISRYELGGAYNGALISTTATSNTVNAATGTVTDTTTTVTEAASANGVQSGQSYTQRTSLPSLFTDFTNWCLGRASSMQQTHSHTGFSGASQTRQTEVSWEGSSCRPTHIVEQPGDLQLQVTTALGYDNFGNVSSQTVTGIGMAARTTSTNWGSTGQFPVSITNALSHTTQMGWNNALGVQSSQTDPNGITTSWQYDSFARRTRENRPDGTYSIWTAVLCGSASGLCYYGDSTHYRVNRYDYGTDNTAFRRQISFFDRLERLTGEAYDTLTSAQVDRRVTYDALGRVASRSQPFFISGGAQYFTHYTYDAVNRVTQHSRPVSDSDPSVQSVTTYYEGLTARIIDPQSKQTTQVATVIGQLARNSDQEGYGQTFSYDAFGNRVRVVDSLGNTLQTSGYNIRGVRTSSTDIDMGAWTYTPNALGETVSQIDANSKTTTFTYDALSRLLTRTEPDGAATVVHTYTWGTSAAAKNIGALEWMQVAGSSVLDNRQTFTYDTLGRLSQTKYTDSEALADYFVDQSYNSITGLADSLTYPTSTSGYRLKLKYEYQNGLLYRISDFNVPATVFWRAYAADPYGHITDEGLGNGLRTARSFDAVTGWIDYIQTGPSGGTAIQNLGYLFDKAGHLIQRQDNRQSLTENFFYDNLYRLDSVTLNGVTKLDLTYNSLGNITNKTGIGAYGYHPAKIHAVQTLGGDPSYDYDANGNGTGEPGGGFTFGYTTSNLPKSANWVEGGYASTFQLGPEGQRFQQVAAYPGGSDSITYIGNLMEKVVSGGGISWKHYILAPTGRIALYTRKSGGTPATEMFYFTRDHLGSIDSITDGAGAVQVRLSYNAFGLRRQEAGWSGAVPNADWTRIYAITHRGFTDHEMLDDLDVIHMNGRLYDPDSGRFVSADPFIHSDHMTQAFNRYSYIWNNSLSATDPSGFDPSTDMDPVQNFQNGKYDILYEVLVGGLDPIGSGMHFGGMAGLGGISGARSEAEFEPSNRPDSLGTAVGRGGRDVSPALRTMTGMSTAGLTSGNTAESLARNRRGTLKGLIKCEDMEGASLDFTSQLGLYASTAMSFKLLTKLHLGASVNLMSYNTPFSGDPYWSHGIELSFQVHKLRGGIVWEQRSYNGGLSFQSEPTNFIGGDFKGSVDGLSVEITPPQAFAGFTASVDNVTALIPPGDTPKCIRSGN